MTCRMLLLLALALSCRAGVQALAQEAPAPRTGEVAELEPNNDPEAEDLLRVAPGCVVTGAIESEEDRDHFRLVVAAETLCDFRLNCIKGVDLRLDVGDVLDGTTQSTREGEVYFALRCRVPAGEHTLSVTCRNFKPDATWRLAISPSPAAENTECEPNDKPDTAAKLELGRAMQGLHSHPDEDKDYWRVEIPRRGVYCLRTQATGGPKTSQLSLRIQVGPDAEDEQPKRLPTYDYKARDGIPGGYVFYPVLEAGAWLVYVTTAFLVEEGYGYTLSLEPFEPAVDDTLVAQARAAITRGETWLQSVTPEKARGSHKVGVEGLVLGALSGSRPDKDAQARLATDYVAWLEKLTEDAEGITWHGQNVATASSRIYEAAIATLGLAEAAEAGVPRARELCERHVRFLLAAQLSAVRSEAWSGPVRENTDHHGGWRYDPDDENADISASGWCLVALLAADAAGIKVEGMRDAVEWGTAFIRRCHETDEGFTYLPKGGGSGNNRNAIGLLLMALMGEALEEHELALFDVDHHLPAGTQVDIGDDYILYYGYYGTRLNYLRGGYPWLAWRSVMIRQLLRQQEADGHWQAREEENFHGSQRYATALAVIILRICLNDVPGYLRPEARGF